MGSASKNLERQLQKAAKDRTERRRRSLQKKNDDALTKAYVAARPVYYLKVSREVRMIYQNAVRSFYTAYHPTMYDRKGKGSGTLRELFYAEYDKSGLSPGFEYGADTDKMHPLRGDGENGYGLVSRYTMFDQLFNKGWHGGAPRGYGLNKGSKRRRHPHPGVPLYRAGFGWRYWGRAAFVSEPPAEIFKKMTNDYFSKNRNDWNNILREKKKQFGVISR